MPNGMPNASPRSGRNLETALSNAHQTVALLRAQVQTGKVDQAFLIQRLNALENLLIEVDQERQQAVYQEKLAKLYHVSRVIGLLLDLQTVLDQVMDAIIQLTEAERGFLMLLDDDGRVKVKVARNLDQETLSGDAFALSMTVTSGVLDSGRAIVTTNALEDPRFAGQLSVLTHSLRSIMASPLRVRGQVIGVVYVDNRIRAGTFSESDLDVLDTFAGQAAVAIDNARLFSVTDKALSARVEELTLLQRVDRQLNETLDTAKAMNITLEWSSRVCNAQSASMGLLDDETNMVRVVSYYGTPNALTPDQASDLDHPLVQRAIEIREAVLQQVDHEAWIFAVPVLREGKAIGVIAMTALGESAFPEDARALVSRMADRAAIAIENARLYNVVRAANNAKSEFVSLVAHELKAPMTTIKGYAELMPVAGPLSDRQKQFLDTMKGAVRSMEVLVSDLNDISRIETGNMRVDLASVNIQECADVAVNATNAEIQRRQHTLTAHIEPDLPAVIADKDRVIQVLINLLSNAYKYTRDGGQITFQVYRQGDHLLCSVTDTGVGMTPDQLKMLGTKFWRADNGLSQAGTGLGFAITRNLIALMDGQLNIQSEPGKGSTFAFTLPIAR